MSVLVFAYKRVTFYQNLAANKPPSPKELATNKKHQSTESTLTANYIILYYWRSLINIKTIYA